MVEGKLTKAQREVLERAGEALGSACSTWLAGRAGDTRAAYRVCRQLERKGLLEDTGRIFAPYFRATPAGRALLKEKGNG